MWSRWVMECKNSWCLHFDKLDASACLILRLRDESPQGVAIRVLSQPCWRPQLLRTGRVSYSAWVPHRTSMQQVF
jgi:hypothetical protein